MKGRSLVATLALAAQAMLIMPLTPISASASITSSQASSQEDFPPACLKCFAGWALTLPFGSPLWGPSGWVIGCLIECNSDQVS